MKTPAATVVFSSPNQTKYLIRFPSSMTKQGASYYATTYPGSDTIFLETAAKRRPVSAALGSKLHPVIKAAIQGAKA